jgi:ferredoxin-type protein NapH
MFYKGRFMTKWYSKARLILPLLYGALLFTGIIYKSFTIIIIFFASSFLFGAFHCGWLCPFGFLQDQMGRLGRKLHLPLFKIPVKWDRILRFSRYILWAIGMTGLGFVYFLNQPYSSFMSVLSGYADTVVTAAWILMGLFLMGSLFIEKPFCRYFCTEGAQYGLLSLGRIFTIRRASSCINCKACDRSCPMGIEVSKINKLRNSQCTNCFQCLQACPIDKALTYGWAFNIKKTHKEISQNEEN